MSPVCSTTADSCRARSTLEQSCACVRRNSICTTIWWASTSSDRRCSSVSCFGTRSMTHNVPSARSCIHQRRTGVEPDVGLAKHQRIPGEPWVGVGVFHDEQLAAEDRVCAERLFPGGLGGVEANARLEPLPAVVHQHHQRDRRTADPGCQAGDLVVGGLRRGVQECVATEHLQSHVLVRWQLGDGPSGCARRRVTSPGVVPASLHSNPLAEPRGNTNHLTGGASRFPDRENNRQCEIGKEWAATAYAAGRRASPEWGGKRFTVRGPAEKPAPARAQGRVEP